MKNSATPNGEDRFCGLVGHDNQNEQNRQNDKSCSD